MVCSSRANSSGYAVTPWGRRSLLPLSQGSAPEDSQWDAVLCIPSAFPRCTPATGTQPCFFTVWQAAGPTVEVKKIYHHLSPSSSWNRRGGRRGQKVFSTCFWQAALVSWPVGHRFLPRCCQLLACSPLLSCTSGTTRWRLKFQRSFHSVGRYQVGRVVWAGETGAALDFRTAGLFYKDSTGAQQLAHCLVWLHVWVLFFVFMFVFFSFAFSF